LCFAHGQIFPGQSYLITRRCTQRQFLLRPSRITNQNVQYCLGLAAERTGVRLHAVCVMSNHWHGVVTDPEARLPEFLELFHQLLAKAQNASLGRWENLWSSDKTSLVLLVSESDVLDKMAYTLANPTAAGLVKSPDEWPGVISHRFSEQRDIEMPDAFFDEDGDMPESVTLEFVRPHIFTTLSDSDLQARLREAVAKRVRRARDDMTLRGLPFVGHNAVLRQSVDAIPKTPAPRRNPSPRIAAKSTPARVAAIRRMLQFLGDYRAAWNDWRNGNRAVVFPLGTYALRIYARVACAPVVPA
jgi:REP-associated tyrosine transposase